MQSLSFKQIGHTQKTLSAMHIKEKLVFISYLAIITACSSNPCLNNGMCAVTSLGEFVCHCVGEYWGRLCEETCKFVVHFDLKGFTLIQITPPQNLRQLHGLKNSL